MVVGMQHQQQQPHASPATVLEDATTPCAASPQPKRSSPVTDDNSISVAAPTKKMETPAEQCSSTTTTSKTKTKTKTNNNSNSKDSAIAENVVVHGLSSVSIKELVVSNGGRSKDELVIKKENEVQAQPTIMISSGAGGRVKLRDVNPHVVCVLCHGYFVDATSIAECLHSFCRSCIILHLATKNDCPICRVQVNSSKPDLSLKPDKTLQDIVYKLVPGLFHAEMKRRNQFYEDHPNRDLHLHPEFRGITVDRLVYSAHNKICLSLEYYDKSKEREDWDNVGTPLKCLNSSVTKTNDVECNEDKSSSRRYFNCPAAVRVADLRKLISAKYSLSKNDRVDLFYRRESLPDDYSLMDIAYIYAWKRNSPMQMYFRIYLQTQVCNTVGNDVVMVAKSACKSSQPSIVTELPVLVKPLASSDYKSVCESETPSASTKAAKSVLHCEPTSPAIPIPVSSVGVKMVPSTPSLVYTTKAITLLQPIKQKITSAVSVVTTTTTSSTPRLSTKSSKTSYINFKNKPKTTKSTMNTPIPTPVPAGLSTSPMKSYLEISSIMNNVQSNKSPLLAERNNLKAKTVEPMKEVRTASALSPKLSTTLTRTTDTTWSVSKPSLTTTFTRTTETTWSVTKPTTPRVIAARTVASSETNKYKDGTSDMVKNYSVAADPIKSLMSQAPIKESVSQDKAKASPVVCPVVVTAGNQDTVKALPMISESSSVVQEKVEVYPAIISQTTPMVQDKVKATLACSFTSIAKANFTSTMTHTSAPVCVPTTTMTVSVVSKTASPVVTTTSSQSRASSCSDTILATKEINKPTFTSMSKAAASKVVCVTKSSPLAVPVAATKTGAVMAGEIKTSVPSSLPPLITLTSTSTTATSTMSSLKIPSSLEISLTLAKGSHTSTPSPVTDLQNMVHQNILNTGQVNGYPKDGIKRSHPEEGDHLKEKYACISINKSNYDDKNLTTLQKEKKISLQRGEISVSTSEIAPSKKMFNPNILPEVSITVNPHPETTSKRLSPERSYDVSCSFKPYSNCGMPPLNPISSNNACKNIQKSPIKSLMMNKKSSEATKNVNRSPFSPKLSVETNSVKRHGDLVENGLSPLTKKAHLENGVRDGQKKLKGEEKSKKEVVSKHQSIPQLIDINAPYAKSRLKLANAAAVSTINSNSVLFVKPPPPMTATSGGNVLDLSSPTNKSPTKASAFSHSPDKKKLIPSVPPQMIPVTMMKGDSKFSPTSSAKGDLKLLSPRMVSPVSKSSPFRKDLSPRGVKLSPSTQALMPGPYIPDLICDPLSLNYFSQQQEWLMNMRCRIPSHPLLFQIPPTSQNAPFQQMASNGVKK